MRMDDQRVGQGSEGQPERQRVRVPLPPPVEWNNMPEQQSPPASRREREVMMRELRGGGNLPGSPLKTPSFRMGPFLRRLFILALIGCLGYATFYFARIMKSMGGGKHGVSSIIGSIVNPLGKFPGQNRITVLLIGKDFNWTNKRMPYSSDARSDSIMLASLDLKNKKASLLSIPRDTYVRAPDGKVGKINGTFARGGHQLLEATIEQLLDIRIDYHVVVRIPGVAEIVDAVKGVEVETIDSMVYHDSWGGLHVNLPEGKQTINGEQAIGFARYRHPDLYERNEDGTPKLYRNGSPIQKRHRDIAFSKEDGDPRRMARQQQLIRAILNKAKSFDNLLQLDQVVNVGLEQIETNLDRPQIFALAALFRSAQPETIQSGTLPGDGGKRGGIWYFQHDPEKSKYMVDWLVHGDETASYKVTRVDVQNGTKVTGAVRKLVSYLSDEGFDAHNAGNAKRPAEAGELDETRILYSKASVLTRAKHIQKMLGGGTLIKEDQPDTSGAMKTKDQRPDVTVVLGRDLADQIPHRSAQR